MTLIIDQTDPDNALRITMTNLAIQAAQAAGIDTTQYLDLPNYPFAQPEATLFARFRYAVATKSSPAVGDLNRVKITGIYQFSVYQPEFTGDGQAIAVGAAIGKVFGNQKILAPPDCWLKTDPAGVKPMPTSVKGFFAVVVDGRFQFWND